MRRRYTGKTPVTLVKLGIEVEPGEVVDLPDTADAEFATRPDFPPADDIAHSAEPGDNDLQAETETEPAALSAAAVKRKTKAASAAEAPTTDETA